MKNKTVRNLFVVFFLFVTLSNMAFPWWTINRSESAFEKSVEKNAISSLESYVVTGAGYFLDSYAHTLLFMRKLELSGENSIKDPTTIQLLDSALNSIKQANVSYIQLKCLADATPYNPLVIDALQKFDYENFCALYNIEDKNFSRAREYLSKGDIRSIYGIMVNDTDRICRLLLQVKSQVNAGTFPSTLDVWKLDQVYSGTERFGQYVSRIFDAVTAAGAIY